MIFDDVLVRLGDIVADGRLAVSFKPQPASSFHYSVVAVVFDGDAPAATDGFT